MATIYRLITTPEGTTAPDIVSGQGMLRVSAGTTSGSNGGTVKTVTHGVLTATEAAPVNANQTGYVFVAVDGSKAWLDPDPDGANLPAGTEAFAVGRAWKDENGELFQVVGRRAIRQVRYDVSQDPTPRKLIDAGSSTTWVTPASPFQGAGGMQIRCDATVNGGNAIVRVVDASGAEVGRINFGSGANQPTMIILAQIGDILQFTTDPGVTITLVAVKAVESV